MEHRKRAMSAGGMIAALAAVIGAILGAAGSAAAHGERAQEPSLRMLTVQFYDTKWSTDKVPVNGEITVSGRFHVMKNWPLEIYEPGLAYLNVAVPGPVFVRVASSIGEVNGFASVKLELGQEYEYKLVLKGRLPGRYHVHPMLDVQDVGPIVGPGKWVTVEAAPAQARFVDPVTTLTGHTVDLASYGLGWVIKYHLVWLALGLAWLVYWIRKPMLMPRYEAVQSGEADQLITRGDRLAALVVLGASLMVAFGGLAIADSMFPLTIPLQSDWTRAKPLPESSAEISVEPLAATYLVPGRSMQFKLLVTNNSHEAVKLGEFTTANLRFINSAVEAADSAYPAELIAPGGLVIKAGGDEIAPGQTKEVYFEATSPIWETDRLASLVRDPTNRVGGLLMFYDSAGKRSVVEFSHEIIPTFTGPLANAY